MAEGGRGEGQRDRTEGAGTGPWLLALGVEERARARTARNREGLEPKASVETRGPRPPTRTELNPDDQVSKEPGPALQPAGPWSC